MRTTVCGLKRVARRARDLRQRARVASIYLAYQFGRKSVPALIRTVLRRDSFRMSARPQSGPANARIAPHLRLAARRQQRPLSTTPRTSLTFTSAHSHCSQQANGSNATRLDTVRSLNLLTGALGLGRGLHKSPSGRSRLLLVQRRKLQIEHAHTARAAALPAPIEQRPPSYLLSLLTPRGSSGAIRSRRPMAHATGRDTPVG